MSPFKCCRDKWEWGHVGLGTCGNRDMWGRDMCPHPNSVGTNGIGTYGVGTYWVGTCGIGTHVLEPSERE